MGVHHLSQTSNKICHSVCDTHPFKSLIEWSVQKNGLCQIDIAIFGADEGTCRERSERNSEPSEFTHLGERQPYDIWGRTRSVVRKHKAPS